MTDLSKLMINRRRLLQVTAAGVTISAIGMGGTGMAEAEEITVRWVSPRGTLEVLDDFAYWVGQKYGYFGDLKTVIEAGPQDGTATVKLVDQNQSHFGY